MKKWMFNIVLGILLLITVGLAVYAATSGPHEAGKLEDQSISLNLYWGYLLLGVAVFMAIFCALFGMIQKPKTLIFAGCALVLIVAVIGVAYVMSNGHDIKIPDLANNSVFAAKETVIAETCLLVTYVAAAAAIVTAIGTEIWRALK